MFSIALLSLYRNHYPDHCCTNENDGVACPISTQSSPSACGSFIYIIVTYNNIIHSDYHDKPSRTGENIKFTNWSQHEKMNLKWSITSSTYTQCYSPLYSPVLFRMKAYIVTLHRYFSSSAKSYSRGTRSGNSDELKHHLCPTLCFISYAFFGFFGSSRVLCFVPQPYYRVVFRSESMQGRFLKKW